MAAQAAARLIGTMLGAPMICLGVVVLSHPRPLQVLECLSVVENLLVLLLFGSLRLASHLALDASPFELADMWETLLAPDHFTKFDVLENHVDLLKFRIVDNFEEGDDVFMSDLLENGDFLLGLVLRGLGGDPTESSFLRKSRNDLDGHVLAGLHVSSQLDLSMHAPANLLNHLILVDGFPTGSGV